MGKVTADDNFNRWQPPRLSDYWDWQQNALNRSAECLRATAEPRWPGELAQIRSGVRARAQALDDSWLTMSAAIMVEDLYKSFSNHVWRIDAAFRAYLSTSTGAFLDVLTERGLVLQHLIDNLFAPTELGMELPLSAFPVLYACAGFVYLCPQQISVRLMEHDDHAEHHFPGMLTRYAAEGRDIASACLQRAHEERRHVVFLEAAADARIPEDAFRFEGAQTFISVYRDTAPVPGSTCRVFAPDGVVLPVIPKA